MIVGLDGFRKKWVCLREAGPSSWSASIIDLDFRKELENADVIAVDTPVGLTETGIRKADQQARRMVQVRGSSVFPAPIRPCLDCETHEEANRLSKEIQNKGVPAQAFGIFPMVRAVDRILQEAPEFQDRVFEVHPEVSFFQMQGSPLEAKHTLKGVRQRAFLIGREFSQDAFDDAFRQLDRRTALETDLLDAFAALWTARRIRKGTAKSLPDPPAKDALGITMAIWY